MTAKKKRDITYSEDTRIALLEQSICHINETLIRFEKRIDQLDNNIKSQFHWTLGLIFGLYATCLATFISVLSKVFHLF